MDINTEFHVEESSSIAAPELYRDALFGDGFFTTAVIENGYILNEKQHLARLDESAKRLKFSQWDSSFLLPTLERITAKHANSIIRISCSRKQKKRGYAFNSNSKIQCNIVIQQPVVRNIECCQLKIAETPISVNSMLAGIKHLNRLDNVMAASECQTPEQEVLMCHGDRVISGSRSNLFVKLDGQWFTPIISDCGINGIMQNVIIETMKDIGISCISKNIYKRDLKNMSSAFVSNSIIGIWPAKSYALLDSNSGVDSESKSELDLECVMNLKKRLKL